MAFIGPSLNFERKPAESLVVSNNDLLQGNIGYQMDRAKKVLDGNAIRQQSFQRQSPAEQIAGTGQNFRDVGQAMLNPEVEKDEGWISKALGPVDWLKYLEVPGELVFGGGMDLASKLTGANIGTSKQGRGASWKALFTDDPDKAGWGEFFGRIDNVYDAFEDRPMWAQFAVMGGQIAVTGGSMLGMKAAQKAVLAGTKGAKAMYLARTLKGASYVIDPWELGWYGGMKGYKGGRALLKARVKPNDRYSLVDDIQNDFVGDGTFDHDPAYYMDMFDEEIGISSGKFIPDIEDIENVASRPQSFLERPMSVLKATPLANLASKLWGSETFVKRYDLTGQGTMGSVNSGDGPITASMFARGDEGEALLDPALETGNTIRELIYDIHKSSLQMRKGSLEHVEAMRELAVLQTNLSMGSRHGQTFIATADGLWADEYQAFLNTGMLRYFDSSTGNTAGLFALDNGEAYVAVRSYKEALEEYASRTPGFEIKGDDQVFTFKDGRFSNSDDYSVDVNFKRGKETKTLKAVEAFKNGEDADVAFSGNLTEILKKYRLSRAETGEALYPKYGSLPATGKDFRSHRVTELHFEGRDSNYIAQLLNHNSIDVTRSYLRAVAPITGELFDDAQDSLTYELTKPLRQVVEITNQTKGEVGVGVGVERVREAVKQVPELKYRAKGAVKGGFELDRLSILLGESLMYDETGKGLSKGQLLIREYLTDYDHMYESLIGQYGEESYAGIYSARTMAKEALQLLGMSRMVQDTAHGIRMADDAIGGTFKNYRGIEKKYATLALETGHTMQTPGILNRAGYYRKVDPTDGQQKIYWAGNITGTKDDALVNKKWIERRNRYAKEANIDPDKMTEADWQEWAELQFQTHERAKTLKAQSGIQTLDGKNSKYMVHEHLADYVDLKIWDLAYRWAEVPLDARNHLGPEVDNIIRALMSGGIGPSMKEMSTGGYKSAGAYVYKELNRLKWAVRSADEVNGLWKERQVRTVEGQDIEGYTKVLRGAALDDEAEVMARIPIDSLKQWLLNPEIISTFGIHKINRDTPVGDLKKAFYELANKAPRVFGEDFAKFATRNETKANKFLDILADRIMSNKHLLEHIDANQKMDFATINDRLATLERFRSRHIDGGLANDWAANKGIAGTNMLHGNLHTTTTQVGRIQQSRGRRLQEWLNKDSIWPMTVLKGTVKIAYAGATGGMAGIAHPLTRVLSARMQSYGDIDYAADKAGKVVNSVARQYLGLQADEATALQQKAGLHQGYEFFTTLKPKSYEEIMEWEKTEGYKHYTQYASDNTNGASLSRLEVEMNGNRSEAMRFLTQTDIVLERIAPEHWDKYFDIKKDSDEYFALVYIKDTIFQMDEEARRRGLSIPGLLKDKDVEYLQRYFPRLYQQRNTVRLINKQSKNQVLNSGKEHFTSRREEGLTDIINAFGYGLGTKRAPEDLHKYVLEGIGTRTQVYIESVQKEITDLETKKWLQAQPEYKAALKINDDLHAERTALQAMENLLSNRLNKARDMGANVEQTLDSEAVNIMNAFYTDARAATLPFGKNTAINLSAPHSSNTAWIVENADEIRDWANTRIARIEAETTNRALNRFSKESEIEWLTTHLDKLTPQQRDAMTQHLTAASTIWGKPAKWFADTLKRPTDVVRYFKSGLDAGAPMIHGFNALVRMPIGKEGFDANSQKAWAEGVKMMGKFMFDPDYYDEWTVANFTRMQEAGKWVRLGNPEPLKLVDDSYMKNMREWVSKQGWAQHKQAKFLSRFEKGFTGYLDVVRTHLWDSMSTAVENELKSTGKGLAPDALTKLRNDKFHELGAVINKMTGAFDPALAQQTPFQSLVESSLLFFAPMYRRATFGIMADITRGGYRTENALRTLSGVVVAGLAMQQLATMTGNSSGGFLDEEGKKGRGEGELALGAGFGKINVAGMQTGIGTAWWTVFRAASDVAMEMYHSGDVDLDRDSWADNPYMEMLGRRGRSQLAPVSALITDVLTGRNFIGEPLRDEDENNYAAILEHSGRSAIPFWLDGAISGNSVGGMGVGMTAEFFGLQSYEISSYDRLIDARHYQVKTWQDEDVKKWRDEQEALDAPVNYSSMPALLQAKINEDNPIVKSILDEHNANYGAIAKGPGKVFYEYSQKKARVNEQVQQTLASVSRQVERGEKSYSDLQKAISNASYARRVNNNALLEEYPELYTWFSELREGKASSNIAFAGDIIYDNWQSMKNSDDWVDEEGVFDFRAMKREEVKFWSDEKNRHYKEYVLDRSAKWMQHLPTVRKFEEAKDYLENVGYWSLEDQIWTRGSAMHGKVKNYLEQPRVYRELYKKQDSTYREIEKRLETKRTELLMKDAYLDEILVTYYGNNPTHPINTGLKEKLLIQNVGATEITPHYSRFKASPSGRVELLSIQDAANREAERKRQQQLLTGVQ